MTLPFYKLWDTNPTPRSWSRLHEPFFPLFQDPNPAIPQVERLESDLIKIEASLGRLKAAAFNTWQEPLDYWDGFLDDLQFALEELPKALENVGEWGVGCIEQFWPTCPRLSCSP